ncbi:MAG: acetylornithine carbamoyltransferase [Prevotella sp.]|nr:acetylornithine carbamoyltransferase [Prevotella sp.]
MRSFINVEDIGPLDKALAEAFEIKNDRFKYQHLGKNKTLMMIFFNNSLRTRLSTQKAAMNLGMNVIVLDVNAGAWKLETERGVIMDGDKSEHLLEAIPVMGCYCDLIGVRSFAGLTDREYDYAETVLNQFIKYSGRPVFAMETATVHPLQAFADLITIEEYWRTIENSELRIENYDMPKCGNEANGQGVQGNRNSQLPIHNSQFKRPKVVLTWAPHCRALPQAVPNSFAQWMRAADVDFVITHPEGYELDPKFVGDARVEYDQRKAFEGADFIYAKNWSNPGVTNPADYGKITSKDMSWTVDAEHMSWTNNAKFMHCLPVRRGLIVTDDVIEGPNSIVIPEAANREISCSVVLKRMLEAL